MTRAEHLDWAKERALEYVDKGEWLGGWISFVSDMNKHDELRGHIAIELGNLQVQGGLISHPAAMRNYIEGFN